jgi:hypothetical protein
MTTIPALNDFTLGVGWNFISALDVSNTVQDVVNDLSNGNTIVYDPYNIYYIDGNWNTTIAINTNWEKFDSSSNYLNPNVGYCILITSIS